MQEFASSYRHAISKRRARPTRLFWLIPLSHLMARQARPTWSMLINALHNDCLLNYRYAYTSSGTYLFTINILVQPEASEKATNLDMGIL